MEPGALAVTGASGFIGGYLQRQLALQGLDFKPINIRHLPEADLVKELARLKVEGIRSLVHLGWPASSTNDYKNSLDNVEASARAIQLGQACAATGIHFFGIGSPAEFFPNESQYGQSKKSCREGLQVLIDSGKVTWLRPHFVFDNHRWPKIIADAVSGVNVAILDNSARSFIHVEDVAAAMLATTSNDLQGEIDILHQRKVRPSELMEALGLPCQIIGEMPARSYPNTWNTSALLKTGWYPKTTEALLGPDLK